MKRGRSWNRFGRAVVCLSVATGTLAGCNRYPDRAVVSGEVRFADGQPIASGVIAFTGQDVALVSGATIEAGRYFVPRAQGLKAGRYRVTINAPDASAAPAPMGAPGEFRSQLPAELIPPRYNRDSQVEITVSEAADQTFDFTIEK